MSVADFNRNDEVHGCDRFILLTAMSLLDYL